MNDTLTKIRVAVDALQWQIRFQLEPTPDMTNIVNVRRKAQELEALLEQMEFQVSSGGAENVAN